MPSLLDIAPPEIATEKVLIERSGIELEVRGLSAFELARMTKRFPDWARQQQGIDIPAENVIALNVDIAVAIAAAGLGFDDAEVESRLTPDEVAKVVEAIMRLTMPSQRPFVEQPGNGDAAESGKARGTKY